VPVNGTPQSNLALMPANDVPCIGNFHKQIGKKLDWDSEKGVVYWSFRGPMPFVKKATERHGKLVK